MELVFDAGPRNRLGKAGLIGMAVSCLLLLGLLAGPVPQAQAHDFCIGHPSDPSVVCVRDGHSRVDVCDRHVDGHRTYARVLYDGGNSVVNLWDNNGGQSGCGNWNNWNPIVVPGGVNRYPYSINVCVQTEGCGSPRYWWEF